MYFRRNDIQFCYWWAAQQQAVLLSQLMSFPFTKNSKGTLKSLVNVSCHIDDILQVFTLVPTVHAPCIYRALIDNDDVLFLHQVDNPAIATNHETLYFRICDSLNAKLLVPLKCQGLLTNYNGLDIIQTHHFSLFTVVPRSAAKLLANHGWSDMNPTHLPMAADNEYIRSLDTAPSPSPEEHRALESAHFRYRGATIIGEHIWAMMNSLFPLSN